MRVFWYLETIGPWHWQSNFQYAGAVQLYTNRPIDLCRSMAAICNRRFEEVVWVLLTLELWLQIGMLMLTAWHDERHDEIGRSFAKTCKKTLQSMHTDDGIYANADLITPDMVNGESSVFK